MTIAVKMLNDQIKRISDTNSLLDMLLEFERFLDESDLYAYLNWHLGELLSGPELDRNYCSIKLMYNSELMPDPEGAARLLHKGCLVKYTKDTLISPVKVTSPDDIEFVTRDNGDVRKKPKAVSKSVWVVELKIPRRYVDEFKTDVVQFDSESYVDTENLNSEEHVGFEEEQMGIKDGAGIDKGMG